MTVGEKIFALRKEHGLSQEELGQMMMVSRQTVSFWETGQTVPTVDNLIRLKEVFGVTVDDLLGCAEKPDEDQPLDACRFRFDDAELKQYVKDLSFRGKAVGAVFITVGVMFLFQTVVSWSSVWSKLLVFGIYGAAAALWAVRSSKNKKAVDARMKDMLEAEYDYRFYEDYFTADVIRNGCTTKTSRIEYRDIEKVEETDDYITLLSRGIGYTIRKAELKEHSPVLRVSKRSPEITTHIKKGSSVRLVSLILFLAAIEAVIVACALYNYLPNSWFYPEITLEDIYTLMKTNAWIFFAFSAIPTASAVFGAIFVKNNKCCIKNIIIGALCLIVLVVSGMLTYWWL